MSVCSVLIIRTCSTTWRPSSNASATLGPYHDLHSILGPSELLQGPLSAQRSYHFPLNQTNRESWELLVDSGRRVHVQGSQDSLHQCSHSCMSYLSANTKLCICDSDANSHVMVGVLSQVLADGKEQVISYNIRALGKCDHTTSELFVATPQPSSRGDKCNRSGTHPTG